VTDYLERARIARSLKALLVGVTSSGRGAAGTAADHQPRPEATTQLQTFAVAGSSVLHLSS